MQKPSMQREIKVLDHGKVVLKGYTIDLDSPEPPLDFQIVQAARVSYTGGTKSVREDKALIDYLVRHGHWSPFEMVEFKFYLEMPLFLVQQLLRHRTANVNQESARYSVLENKIFVPKTWRKQDTVNKQGSHGEIKDGNINGTYAAVHHSLQAYNKLLDLGVAREQARCVLPVSTYTKLYWKIDLRNLLHFLKLRMDTHAQQEMQEYAKAILSLIEPLVPWTVEAWKNHVQNSVHLSADVWSAIKSLVSAEDVKYKLQENNIPTSRIREVMEVF